jgi:hypothetical protein
LQLATPTPNLASIVQSTRCAHEPAGRTMYTHVSHSKLVSVVHTHLHQRNHQTRDLISALACFKAYQGATDAIPP